jgi:hypothetical protein
MVFDFVGLIKLARQFTSNKYILITINYAIKWVEAKALGTNTIATIIKFLYEYLLTRFGYPLT